MFRYVILRFKKGIEPTATGGFYKEIVDEPFNAAKMVREFNNRNDGYEYYFERTSGYIPPLEYFKNELQRAFGVLGFDEGELQNERDINAWEKNFTVTNDQAAELRKYNREFKNALIAIQNG